jgi:UDP-2,3-diacylglucosamine pyrophosphatase LpxH
MKHSKWLAKLGAYGYDLLILINTFCNWTLTRFGREKISLSKTIKNNVKKAVKFISDFEKTAIDIAISNEYQFVLCGHIHHPEIKYVETEKGNVTYLNSGDWVENLSALEYYNNQWHLYKYNPEEFQDTFNDGEDELITMNDDDLFKQLLQEFKITTSAYK